MTPLPVWFRKLLLLDQRIDRGMYYRASGDCLCGLCGRDYWRHPECTGSQRWSDMGWLHLLCNGDLVHL